MEIGEKVKEIAQAWLPAEQFIVEVVFSGKKMPARLLVIVDGDKGVTIDQCALLSRYLSDQLDAQNLIAGAYHLEVSTPGLDHPLKLQRQFVKNVGRQMKVVLTAKETLIGKLTEADHERITIDVEVKEGKKKEVKPRSLAYAEIEKAFVMVSFK